MPFFKDLNLSAATAGFVAVLVGFTSSVAIVFQAAQAFGATPAQITSWMWALGLGMGLCSAIPSLILKQPVMVAWSTPGAAVLATAGLAGGFSMAEAIGAFMVCGALITVAGATGWFERVMNKIPMALASALLAGVLARFGLQAFAAAQTALVLVVLMLLAYLLGRRLAPRYAVVITLLVSVAYVVLRGQFNAGSLTLELARPMFTTPVFTLAAFTSLALPLFVVTMASQNLPGVAAIRSAGYDMPISKIITLTGVATLVLAPFGAFALNLSAITAAICMGPEAHPDPKKRYTAAVTCGAIYVLIGLFGAAVTGLLIAFPRELVLAIAGIALLGSIGGGLHAVSGHAQRRGDCRHRLGLLGCGGRRPRAVCATVRPSSEKQAMNILVVADPLVTFKTTKDTTFAMMRELQKRGHTLAACEPQHLQWQTGQPVTALVRRIELTGAADDWYRVLHQGREALHTFDAVLMRKDPPFDSEFFYATHLLEQAEREGEAGAHGVRPVRAAHAGDALARSHPPLPRRAQRHHPEAAGRHGRHGHLPRRARWHEPGLHHRNAQPGRRHQRDGAGLSARDRGRRQTPAAHRREGRALRARAHSTRQRDPRQPGRWRQGRGPAAE